MHTSENLHRQNCINLDRDYIKTAKSVNFVKSVHDAVARGGSAFRGVGERNGIVLAVEMLQTQVLSIKLACITQHGGMPDECLDQ